MKTILQVISLMLAVAFLFSSCGRSESNKTPQEEKKEKDGSVTVETIETEAFKMDYCRFGRGGKTLVILPGLSIQSVMGSAEAIAEAYQLFADEYMVYVFERRQELPQTYTVFDTARDTAAAFKAAGLGHIDLFGASYGGMVTMVIAAQYPELIDNAMIASTSACLSDEEYKTIENWISLAKDKGAEALYLAFGEAVYPREVYEQSKELLIDAAKTVTEEDMERFVILAEGMKGFDISGYLDKIQCPVLAIGDKSDNVLGASVMEDICRYMEQKPDFESYMYDGYGHAVYDMAPDFKDRLLNFLKK